MFPSLCFGFDKKQKNITKENALEIHDFIFNETKSYACYANLRNYLTCYLQSDEAINLEGRNLLVNFAKMLLINICKFERDGFTKSIATEYNAQEFIDILLHIIHKQSKEIEKPEMLEVMLCDVKAMNFKIPKYSYEDAFNILSSNKSDEEKALIFSKIILLSDDYFNIDILLKLRSHILSSKSLTGLHKYFFKTKPNEKIFSLFFSDYKLIIPMINEEIYDYYDENKCFGDNLDFTLVYFYGKFILNMTSFLYSIRSQYDFSGKNAKDKIINRDGKYKIDLVLNKLCNAMDYQIFNNIEECMTDNEILWFIVRKNYEDVLFHAQNSLTLEKMSKIYSFMVAITKSINANDNDNIIEEMANIALKEWNKLNTLSHIQMIEFLKKTDRFAESLKKRGVERKMKKRLKEICKQNNFPYIEGTDMFTGAGRKKSSLNNTEKHEKKKRTKKMA